MLIDRFIGRLIQLQHFNERTKDHVLIAQRKFPDNEYKYAEWIKPIQERHPLPPGPGWVWMSAWEHDPLFFRGAGPDELEA